MAADSADTFHRMVATNVDHLRTRVGKDFLFDENGKVFCDSHHSGVSLSSFTGEAEPWAFSAPGKEQALLRIEDHRARSPASRSEWWWPTQ